MRAGRQDGPQQNENHGALNDAKMLVPGALHDAKMLVPGALNDTKTIRKAGGDMFANVGHEKP